MASSLVFVYDAESGFANAVVDVAYTACTAERMRCSLLPLIRGPFGVRRRWKRIGGDLGRAVEYVYRDQFAARHDLSRVTLPAVFKCQGSECRIWLAAEQIRACRTSDDLERLVRERARTD